MLFLFRVSKTTSNKLGGTKMGMCAERRINGFCRSAWLLLFIIWELPAAGLSAHTLQALATGPVSALIPNAECYIKINPVGVIYIDVNLDKKSPGKHTGALLLKLLSV